jgi:preprotein translocase subunit SecF
MFDTMDIDWMWMLVGFIVGISSAWFVSDLVFPVVKHKDDDND